MVICSLIMVTNLSKWNSDMVTIEDYKTSIRLEEAFQERTMADIKSKENAIEVSKVTVKKHELAIKELEEAGGRWYSNQSMMDYRFENGQLERLHGIWAPSDMHIFRILANGDLMLNDGSTLTKKV